ncbi:MAG: SDR family NAD(P)-dependent oxidoreductase [Coriobacteriia bacterium]|nr:SDR family NAD(P)-dependent oxidoreductase [Coriobacteriia bacterium]
MRDMRGKTVLVTGATDGIGKRTATTLASLGAHVIVTGRNPKRGSACVADITTSCGHDRVEAMFSDLSTTEGVRDLAAQVQAHCASLDVLVNNAGMAAPERRITPDGLEADFAVNVIAPHLLTTLLHPLLAAASAGRIITLAGGEHPPRLDLHDLQSESEFEGLRTYSRTKLLMMALMYERAQRTSESGVTCNVCYPGQASTSMTRSVTADMLPPALRFAFPVFRMLVREDGGKSALRASRSSVFLASSPDVEGVTGAYFDKNSRRVEWPAPILDSGLRARLWETAQEVAGIR